VGDTTKRLPASGIPAEKSDAFPASPTSELQLRIPCAGRTSEQVLEDVSRGLTEALAKERDPLLILEDLGRLQDSIMSLVKGLSRLVYKYPRPVACWEFSGYAEAFLSVIDAAQQPSSAPPEPPSDC